MDPAPQLNLFGGEARREAGVTRVITNNAEWAAAVRNLVCRLPAGTEFTSDDVRMQCHLSDIPNPKHGNAWGGLLNTAAKSGIIKRIGDAISKIKTNNGRRIGLWRKL